MTLAALALALTLISSPLVSGHLLTSPARNTVVPTTYPNGGPGEGGSIRRLPAYHLWQRDANYCDEPTDEFQCFTGDQTSTAVNVLESPSTVVGPNTVLLTITYSANSPPSASTTTLAPAHPVAAPTHKQGIPSAGAVIGIVCGALGGGIFCAVAFFCLRRKQTRGKNDNASQTTGGNVSKLPRPPSPMPFTAVGGTTPVACADSQTSSELSLSAFPNPYSTAVHPAHRRQGQGQRQDGTKDRLKSLEESPRSEIQQNNPNSPTEAVTSIAPDDPFVTSTADPLTDRSDSPTLSAITPPFSVPPLLSGPSSRTKSKAAGLPMPLQIQPPSYTPSNYQPSPPDSLARTTHLQPPSRQQDYSVATLKPDDATKSPRVPDTPSNYVSEAPGSVPKTTGQEPPSLRQDYSAATFASRSPSDEPVYLGLRRSKGSEMPPWAYMSPEEARAGGWKNDSPSRPSFGPN